jgi:hypothetical protein
MDRVTTAAVAILLLTLGDKVQRPKIRRAMFKVFRTIGEAYSTDEAFIKWAKFYSMEEPKQE